MPSLPHGHARFNGGLGDMKIMPALPHGQYGGLEGMQLGLDLPHGHARSIGGLEGM